MKNEAISLVKKILEEKKESKIEVDEGILDRLLAKGSGLKSQLSTMASNIPGGLKAITTGSLAGIKNPQAIKLKKMVLKRNGDFINKLVKVYSDYVNDLELLFGEDLSKAPSQLKDGLKNADKYMESFLKDIKKINTDIERTLNKGKKTSTQPTNEPTNQEPTENK